MINDLLTTLEILPLTQQTRTIECRAASLDCEHDTAALKRGMAEVVGVGNVAVYPKSANVTLTYDPKPVSDGELKTKLGQIGLPPHPGRELPSLPKPWRNLKVITSAPSPESFPCPSLSLPLRSASSSSSPAACGRFEGRCRVCPAQTT